MKMNMPVDAETHAAFQQQAEQQQAKQEQQAEQEEKRKSMLLSVLSPEARERLGRISTVKPEKARQVENMIIQAVSRGQVRPPVDEEQLISLLEQISGGSATSSGPSITIKRKVADDDDW
eukprot:CAMPEP_0174327930 /NCGR_PEP_ID=MMETSP0810-20121108/14804_1 /TAXON_ID=73025 ORGANISM="Eutreptiella gymnastica-like, Strain CCMP1594" /NCGR_SAMPLE_ID=MMETSP0810 /ASSEMBLY_ACC=CAM_ASM_000659 /LENGTH=119 /DNA_ID=CAMNT_0015441859 /DNA_START=26 /DNA_END=385 /DNA_ORIENTATION=+